MSPDLIGAQEALAAFDAANLDIDAAFWSLQDDDEWAFYVHTTLYELSRKQVYTRLWEALRQNGATFPLEVIKLLPADSDLLKALRSTYSFGLDWSPSANPSEHLHVGPSSTVGGHLIRYLVIYRL